MCDGFHHTFFCYRVCSKAVNPSRNVSHSQPPTAAANPLPVTTEQKNATPTETNSVLSTPDSVQTDQSLDVNSSIVSVQSAKALVGEPVQY